MLCGKSCNRWRTCISSFVLLCYDKVQLWTRLVLSSSTYPHLPVVVPRSLLPTGHSVCAKSLSNSSALDLLVPAHCPLLSLDQCLRHPRNPSCRILVYRALCHCWGRPSWPCPFILRTCPYLWDCKVVKEMQAQCQWHPWNHPVSHENMVYLVSLVNFLYLYDKEANTLEIPQEFILCQSVPCTSPWACCVIGTVWMLGT